LTIGSHTILLFPHQTLWQNSNGNTRIGPSNAGGVGINRDSRTRLSVDHWWSANNCNDPPCSLPHTLPRISESMFITNIVDDHDEEKRTEQNLFVRSGKSEAEVTEDCARRIYHL